MWPKKFSVNWIESVARERKLMRYRKKKERKTPTQVNQTGMREKN